VNALSKAIMAEDICEKLNIGKADAKVVVDSFFEVLRKALENGHHVKLSGFGNFRLRDKKKRPGRNPKTGEEIPVNARRVVTFKPGLKLKTKIEIKSV